ncbi:unnamed protein product [Durusdinium trenchii]|uniref:Pumilio domain member 4 n=2 Tax=Durusdinium trenchii TaxID=1381693 RepID=A0ABP0JZX8_9DINO
MVLAEAVAGAAAGAHALWEYNRDNFLYDRKMRQETELKILEWRASQSELWRDDVRDIIGLTQRKMDSYLIVSTLLLGMCLGLYTEGRLQPGTPPFLIHYYMLTLSAAFMYLLMSVWLAVHASIVAQCSAVRLLTQFVRLPIPTWQALQNMRTFACNYEKLDAKDMLRVPFTRNPSTKDSTSPTAAPHRSGRAGDVSSWSAGNFGPIDPWRLEENVEDRDLYELQQMPALRRRHVQLARRAARQFQSYDSFARVSMAFGTHQLMQAICYYCLGYVALQDGSPWASVGVLILMCVMTISLVQLDFEMSPKETAWARILIVAGPLCAGTATYTWSVFEVHARLVLAFLLPLTYAAHGLWLFFALVACGLEMQPKTGVILPQKFRAVLYMDVFGVLKHHKGPGVARPSRQRSSDSSMREQSRNLWELKREIQANMKLFQSESVKGAMDDVDRHRADRLVDRARKATKEKMTGSNISAISAPSLDEENFVLMKGYTDFGTEVEYLYNPKSGEARPFESEDKEEEQADVNVNAGAPSTGASGGSKRNTNGRGQKVRTMTEFDAKIEEYCVHRKQERAPLLPPEALQSTPSRILHHAKQHVITPVVTAVNAGILEVEDESEEEEFNLASCREGLQNPSGEMSSKDADFGHASFMKGDEDIVSGHDKIDSGKYPAQIFRTATLLMVLLWVIGLAVPFGVFREFLTKPLKIDLTVGTEKGEEEIEAVVGTSPNGLPELIPISRHRKDLHSLLKGRRVEVQWPSVALRPRTLSCDPSGSLLVVADDLAVYAGRVEGVDDTTKVTFDQVPPCVALEGQAVQDVSVACGHAGTAGVASEAESHCRVLVLHAKGRLLAECPLQETFRSFSDSAIQTRVAALPSSEPEEWQIQDKWLHHAKRGEGMERIKALAAKSECMMGDFREIGVGCVVAGTSEGRVVELRESHVKMHTLVPELPLEQRNKALRAGSLHFSSKGYVMVLRRETSSVQAFDAVQGTNKGEWRLPTDIELQRIEWLTLSGGGGRLFALGVRNRQTELYEFPLPTELQRAAGDLE